MRIFIRSSHSGFRSAAQPPHAESRPANWLNESRRLGDRGYASTLNRRQMVTSAMHDGFVKAQRWEHEMSGPFTWTYDSAFTHLPWIAALMCCAFAGPDGKNVELDFRLTIGLRKIDGQRTILHEHHSIPAAD